MDVRLEQSQKGASTSERMAMIGATSAHDVPVSDMVSKPRSAIGHSADYRKVLCLKSH